MITTKTIVVLTGGRIAWIGIGLALHACSASPAHGGEGLCQSVPAEGKSAAIASTWSCDTGCMESTFEMTPQLSIRPNDSIALFREFRGDLNDDRKLETWTAMLVTVGTVCGNAKQHDACSKAFADAQQPSGACVSDGDCKTFVVTTDGDKVTRGDGLSTLMAAIGAVDSPEKATLVLMYGGHSACPATPLVTATTDGFDVAIDHPQCSEAGVRTLLHVARDGTITAAGAAPLPPMRCLV
jgi:hypothetical protein